MSAIEATDDALIRAGEANDVRDSLLRGLLHQRLDILNRLAVAQRAAKQHQPTIGIIIAASYERQNAVLRGYFYRDIKK